MNRMVQLGARQEARLLPTVRTIADLRAVIASWRRDGDRIGVVPTMGALHDGHLALIRHAKADCDRVVATLFVNPIQFDRKQDLSEYPRDEAADAALLAAEGVDLLYAPDVAEIYPPGFATKVAVPSLTNCLCGLHRPGHMDGVATVVAKLFLQVTPDVAYFGEKDYQQLLVVARMAGDLDIPVRVVGVPTVREADGLALSSRNHLLSPDERRRAPTLHRVLAHIALAVADGAAAEPLLEWGRAELAATGFDPIDYLELRRADTLAPVTDADQPARIFGAAWLGKTRLIDNLRVG
jgi:pantoate--beta-alanine ligase